MREHEGSFDATKYTVMGLFALAIGAAAVGGVVGIKKYLDSQSDNQAETEVPDENI